jgi:tetratricopeptide (TPR) repeat protein
VSEEWMRQSAARTGSLSAFTRDMLLAARAAAAKDPPDRREELRASLAGMTAASIAGAVPPEALGVLARAGQAERALDLARLVQPYFRPDAYYQIATALQAGGDGKAADAAAAKAIAVAVSRDRDSGSDHELGSLLSSMHGSGMTQWAVQAATSFHAEGRLDYLDEYYGSLVVEVWAKAGNADGAWRVARRFSESSPSYYKSQAFKTVAIALAQAGRAQDAIEAAREAGTESPGLFGEIAAIVAERGEVPATVAVIRSAPEGDDRRQAVGKAGEALARAGRVDDIAELMTALAGPDERRLATYQVARALAGSGEAARAVSMWRAVATEEDKEYFVADLAKTAAEAGDIAGALRIAAAIGDGYSRNKAQTYVACAAARAGDLPRAAEIVRVPGDRYAEDSALAEVVKDLTGHGRFDDAMTLADLITGPGSKAESLTGVAAALTVAGHYPRAAALAEATAEATAHSAGPAHARALLAWATAVARSGRPQEAVGIAERAVTAEREGSDKGLLAEALSTWSGALNSCGRADAAAAAAGQAVGLLREDGDGDEYFRHGAWAESVAAILAEAGPPADAVAVAQSVDMDFDREKTLGVVAMALAGRGLAGQAIEAARAAVTLSPYTAEEKLKEVASILARHGHGDGARQAIAALADITGTDGYGAYNQARLASEVAKILAQRGDVDAALSVARDSGPGTRRPAALTEVACAVALAGDVGRATRIAEDVSPQALAKVADALAQAGRTGDALPLAEDAIRQALALPPTFPGTANALASLLSLATVFRPGNEVPAREDPVGPLHAIRRAIEDLIATGTADGIPALAAMERLARTEDPALRDFVVTTASQAVLRAHTIQDPRERVAVLGNAASALAGYGESAKAAAAAGECLAVMSAYESAVNGRTFDGRYAPGLAIGVLADVGRAPEALAWIGSLGSDAGKATALTDVAGRMVRNDQTEDLLRFLRDTSVAELIPDADQRISALSSVGIVLAQAGEATVASRLAEEITGLTGELTEDHAKAIALVDQALLLSALARGAEAASQVRLALAMPRGSIGLWWRNVVIKAVEALAGNGHVEEAAAAAETVRAGNRGAAAAIVGAALLDAGQQDRAIELVGDEFAAACAGGQRDVFYDLLCEHLPRHPDLFRAWLGDGNEIAQTSAELAAIEQWWAQ